MCIYVYKSVKIIYKKWNYSWIMGKVRKDISIDEGINKVITEQTENGEFCLSRYVNTNLKEKFKDVLKKKN